MIQEELPYPEPSPEELVHPPDFRPFFTLIENPETNEHYHPNIHYIFSDDDPAFLTTAILDDIAIQNDESLSAQNTERVIVLDISADGKTVTDAQSLSPDWQVTNATITQAPSWNESESETREGNLMLTLSGTEGHGRPIYPHKKTNTDGTLGRLDNVVAGYHERLTALDRLVKKHVSGDADIDGVGTDEEPGQA